MPNQVNGQVYNTKIKGERALDQSLEVERWDAIKHGIINMVPVMEGGWRFETSPLHLWHLKTFKAIGDYLTGFEDYVESNSMLIDCVKFWIKIRYNYCGFIPTKALLLEGECEFKMQVVTHQDGNLLIDRVAGIHGSFSSIATPPSTRGRWN